MSDIRVRVGQQNSVKVISSVSGGSAFADNATTAVNVIGGIASVTQLNVSGVSTFAGITTITGETLFTRQLNVSGFGTIPTLSGTTVSYNTGNFTVGNIVTGIVTSLTSTNATLTNINSSGISTLGVTSATNLTVQQLYVSGITTLAATSGIVTTGGDLYVGGDLYINDDLIFDEFTARNGNITGILTVAQSLYYLPGEQYGVAYFDNNDQLVSTSTTSYAVSETNYILSTNSSGIPTWANILDGGSY